MKIKFNVKDKSAHTFLEERLLGYKVNESSMNRSAYDGSPYHLMKDEMYFKKDCGILVGEEVVIELSDMTHNSRKELLNIYTYKAEKYDDVAIKIVLTKFEIKTV